MSFERANALRKLSRLNTETIAEKCLRNSREALRRHESGEFPLPAWVLEHHKARVAESMPQRQPGDDFEEDAVSVEVTA